jgi:hypothetical protein
MEDGRPEPGHSMEETGQAQREVAVGNGGNRVNGDTCRFRGFHQVSQCSRRMVEQYRLPPGAIQALEELQQDPLAAADQVTVDVLQYGSRAGGTSAAAAHTSRPSSR